MIQINETIQQVNLTITEGEVVTLESTEIMEILNLEVIDVVVPINLEVKEEAYIINKDIIKYGKVLVFKIETNPNNHIQEIGDYCMGFVEGQFIMANYLGGNELSLSSYNI